MKKIKYTVDWFHNVIEESYRRIGAIGGFFS